MATKPISSGSMNPVTNHHESNQLRVGDAQQSNVHRLSIYDITHIAMYINKYLYKYIVYRELHMNIYISKHTMYIHRII